MIYQSPSEYKAMQLTVDFLNECPARVSGQEFADRMLNLFRKFAERRIKKADWNASIQTIRNHFRIGEEEWMAVANYLRLATEQKSPIIVSEAP